MPLMVGYAQGTITPSLDRPVYLAGFGHNRCAESVHDELYACSLALSDGTTTLVLVSLDLIGLLHDDAYEIINYVQARHPGVHVIIASVHTHHGPDTIGLWGPNMQTSGVDPDYMFEMKNRVVKLVTASLAKSVPAMLKTANVHVPGLVKNTRDPAIIDDELTVAQFIGPKDRPLVNLLSFPCHAEVLWEYNQEITADYIACFRAQMQFLTEAPSIFFAGGLGGMLTPDTVDHSFEEADAMGIVLADRAAKALKTSLSQGGVRLGFATKPISVKLTNLLYKLAFTRGLLRDGRDKQGYITSEVSLLRIGDMLLAAVPGELLPKLGLQLKERMRQAGARTVGILGLANDELGYILPVEDFKYPLNPLKPGKNYEETNSIGKYVAPAVMWALEDLIQGKTNA